MNPSESAPSWYRWDGDRLILEIHVQPRASRDEIVGPLGGHLKVRITAPPVDGQANKHLIRFLARQFRVAPGRVSLQAGTSGRYKRLAVSGPEVLLPGMIRAKTN